jgi:S1-C subfamily serine protease
MSHHPCITAVLVLSALFSGATACGQPEPASASQTEPTHAHSLGARFVPALEAGSISGLNVYDVEAAGIAAGLGLHDEDHITQVAGQALTCAEQVDRLLESLEQGARPELVIERDDERVVLGTREPSST